MAYIVDGPEDNSCKCKHEKAAPPAGTYSWGGVPISWDVQAGYEYVPGTNATTYLSTGSSHVPKCENCGYCKCCGRSSK
jgi:hypothetical protein